MTEQKTTKIHAALKSLEAMKGSLFQDMEHLTKSFKGVLLGDVLDVLDVETVVKIEVLTRLESRKNESIHVRSCCDKCFIHASQKNVLTRSTVKRAFTESREHEKVAGSSKTSTRRLFFFPTWFGETISLCMLKTGGCFSVWSLKNLGRIK